MEEIYEEMDMDLSFKEMTEYDYQLFRKRYGYWGWRYLDYLYDNFTAAWYLLLEREDCDEFMHTLNEQCMLRMRFIMETLFDDEKVNSHNAGDGIQKELYRCVVEAAKQIVFEDCLELLKYASWIAEASEFQKEIDWYCRKLDE